ncbi:hypothetical protein C2G38_2242845 [Gigaspora rosea]|uniref:Nudix hydrolase domain-containing protein n=1 Tax=Gigaspora rosea TaxID=44941 RepID=A0A397VQA3_9GLOM|nr:hypothetical protein C2G38_2242845 [Gigaspora rosea]
MAELDYNAAKTNYSQLASFTKKYFAFLNTLKEMRKHGFTIENKSVLEKQIQLQLEINRNLMQQSQEVIDKIEEEVREFTLNVLVSPSKQVYLSRRNNSSKDFFNRIQVAGGHKRKDESFEECAIHETLEEVNVAVKELNYVDIDEGFRVFPDKKECLFRTLIYFTILEDGKVPEQTEPANNDPWIPYDLKEFRNIENLTDSLSVKMDKIISAINSKFLTFLRKRKRKRVENESNVGSPEINITDFEEMITGEVGETVELNGVVDFNWGGGRRVG